MYQISLNTGHKKAVTKARKMEEVKLNQPAGDLRGDTDLHDASKSDVFSSWTIFQKWLTGICVY